jgi:hypothetical protein
MFDLTNQINQVIVFTLVMIVAFMIMAFGTYLIIIVSFRLPFLFWVRHEAPDVWSAGEALNPTNVGMTESLTERPRMAA